MVFDFIFPFCSYSCHEILIGTYYPVFLITINVPLFIPIMREYTKSGFCSVVDNSVCIFCGCGVLVCSCCTRKPGQKAPLLGSIQVEGSQRPSGFVAPQSGTGTGTYAQNSGTGSDKLGKKKTITSFEPITNTNQSHQTYQSNQSNQSNKLQMDAK